MADFSELCPLFNIGVLGEVTFPHIRMSDFSSTGQANALKGTRTQSDDAVYCFTFGRTVIVTGAFLRRIGTGEGSNVIILNHHTTHRASGVGFATLTSELTMTASQEILTWVPFTSITAKTFTSSEVLGMGIGAKTVSAGIYDLIVRYKEK